MTRTMTALWFALAASVAPVAAAAAPSSLCDYARDLRFGEWVGDWVGYKANKVSAHETITLNEQCSLIQEFSSVDGTAGRAVVRLNEQGKLEQPYYALKPTVGTFPGGELTNYDDHHFTFTRNSANSNRSRLTWELIGPGAARQMLENSDDGGKTWTTAFELFLFKPPSR